MKNKDLKKMFLQESAKIDIEMSETTKNTPIRTSKQEIKYRTKKKTGNYFRLKFLLPVAAFSCILILGLAFILPLTSVNTASALTAYVIEINPAIALVADEDDNLINICAINEDADSILSDAEFLDVSGIKLNEAIEKIIKITANEGILDGYGGTIKIFALNDDEKVRDGKLEKFGDMVEKGLKEFGHGEIGFEKKPMEISDFRDKMGFDKDFNRLDDMKEDILNHDRFKKNPPPPPIG